MATSRLHMLAAVFLVTGLVAPPEAVASVAVGETDSRRVESDDGSALVAKRKKRRKGKKKRKAKQEQPAQEIAAEPAAPEPAPAAEPAVEPEAAVDASSEPTESANEAATEPVDPTLAPVGGSDDSVTGTTPAAAGAVETIEAMPVDTVIEQPLGAEVEPPKEDEAKPVFPLTFGVELGVCFPQVASDLRTTFIPTLEVGFLLPVMQQRLEIFASGAYVFPDQSEVVVDPRFTNGGDYRYRITEEELVTTVGTTFRIFPPRAWLNFYGQAGLQVRWQRSEVRGNADGEPIGINNETKVAVGGVLGGGVELLLGPGAIAAELSFALSDLSHRVTGDASTGGMALQIGYHFLL